jgi:hypothetical protein
MRSFSVPFRFGSRCFGLRVRNLEVEFYFLIGVVEGDFAGGFADFVVKRGGDSW